MFLNLKCEHILKCYTNINFLINMKENHLVFNKNLSQNTLKFRNLKRLFKNCENETVCITY